MTEEICECGHKKEHHHSLIKFKDNKGECSKCECKKFTLKNEGNHSLISDINEGLRTLSKELLPAEKNHSPEKLRKLQILGASINVPKKKIKKRKYLSTLKMYQKKKLKREDTSNSKETLSDKIVRTPKEVTKALLLNEKFNGNILEPCCGDGAISEVLKKEGYNVQSSDKFDYSYGKIKDVFHIVKRYDNIITNPPFNNKEAVEICKHLLKIYDKKLVLLWYVKNIGRILEGKTGEGLKKIYIIGRINWKETKLGWTFAWYVWEKGYKGIVTIDKLAGEKLR